MKKRFLQFYDSLPAWVLAALIFGLIAANTAFMCVQAWKGAAR